MASSKLPDVVNLESPSEVASSEKVSRPSGKASSRASKPSSHSTKSAQPSSRGGLSSKSTEQVGQGAAHSTEEVSRGKFKSPAEDKETSGRGMEIILLGDQSPEVSGESAPVPVRTEPEGSEGIPAKIGGKGVAADPSLPSPGNSLKTSGITSESPASAVADLLREQMFGGATEASDPRLLALTGLLASFTKEQVTGLFMEVDVRDSSLRESVDRRIEEARLEENISATSDARGNLVAAREQIQSLQVELHSALEALRKAEEKTAETAKHTSSLEDELSRTRNVLQEADERAATLEVRCRGVLEQLSSMTEALKERDEAVSQKAEVQRQFDALKADLEGLQTHLEEVKAQRETALARVQVLEQELSTSSDRTLPCSSMASSKLPDVVNLESPSEVASSEKVSRPSGKASSRASKPSSHSAKSAQPSSRGGLSSKSTEQVGQGAAHSTEEVSRGKFKSPAEDKETSGTGMEIILLGDQSPEVSGESAPAPVRTEPEGSEGIPAKIGGKRLASSGKSASSPVRKKSRVAIGSSPALPPIGKGKGVAAGPSLPSPGNSLKTSGITSESPASAVADLLREQMFGGATEASDPRLLALTGLLASFTKEQASFQSRSREELGSSIREMLLMVTGLFMEVDVRDRSLRESVDRRIEEARLEENISATSDARGNLVAAREQIQSLQVELHSALEALRKAEEKTAETAKHTSSLEDELSRTRNVLQEADERAATLEVRCRGVLEQLSSMTEALKERDEAVSQKAEVQRQFDALKADLEGLQTHLEEVKAQRETALAQVQVLEQELSTSSDHCRRDRDRPVESSSEGSELGSEEDDPDSVKESRHPGSDVAPAIESSGPKDTELPSGVAVNRNSEGVLIDVSPLRTIHPPSSPEK
ncbi:triadin-like [Manihot esculenta]|uniref:triadin-like n=1 Tax=Manihot esculenta TaxID=3983 RepID=UPI001CC615AF|nr:triadin-like [Manihot esculenta]